VCHEAVVKWGGMSDPETAVAARSVSASGSISGCGGRSNRSRYSVNAVVLMRVTRYLICQVAEVLESGQR